MADITLKSGKEITFDLAQITMKQWREMHAPTFSDDSDDELLAKVTGIPADELAALPMQEYKRLFDALVKKLRTPLSDPN